MSEKIFNVKTPIGYHTYCTSDRWNGHICSSHPDMKDRLDEVIETVSDPNFIYASDEPEGRDVYYGATTHTMQYIRVIVQPPKEENDDGEVVTAFASNTIGDNVKGIKHVRSKIRR